MKIGLTIFLKTLMIAKLLILFNGLSGFRYGNLEDLNPTATPEQITAIRVYNYNLFSTLVTDNLDGSPKTINPGRIEMHYEAGTKFNISNGQVLNLTNNANIICYPLTRSADSILFKINTGGQINVLGSGSFSHIRYPDKSEVYNCTLNYGGNQAVIKLNTVPRAGFLDSIVGQVIYVSEGMEMASIARTVVSYLGDEITVNTNISVAPNTTNAFTNIAYKFPTNISLADYDTYSGYWWNNYTHNHIFIDCLPLVAEPNPALIHVGNNLSNFTVIINVSAENYHITFSDGVTLSKCVIACTAYSQNTYGLQSIDFATLNFNNCGILILGGDGGPSQHITDNNILGSGFYIHPSIIVNGNTLNINNCLAAAWRWYGFDTAVTKGYINTIQRIIATGVNTEYVLRTSFTEQTNIGVISVPDDKIFLNQGTFNDVDAYTLATYYDGLITVGAPLITINTLKVVESVMPSYNSNQNVLINSLSIKQLFINDYILTNLKVSRNVIINSLNVLDYTGFNTFTKGGVESGNVFAALLRPSVTYDIIIENAIVEAKCGIFINAGSPTESTYTDRILVKNSSILCSRILMQQSYIGFFRDVLTFENTQFNSIALGQGSAGRAAQRVFRIKPIISSATKTPVAGVLEFEFQNELTVNGGTIRKLYPYSYDALGNKVIATNYFVGSVTIHAVGSDVILEGYDVYPDSNIAVSETILAGTSKVLTCDTDNVRGTVVAGGVSIIPSNGTINQYITLGVLPVIPVSVTTSFGTILLAGSENIASVNVVGMWDKINDIMRLDFSGIPTGNITLNYSTYTGITAKGTWF